MWQVPQLSMTLFHGSARALASCNQASRFQMHSLTQRLVLPDIMAIRQLERGYWPRLAVVIVHYEDPKYRYLHNRGIQWPQLSNLSVWRLWS